MLGQDHHDEILETAADDHITNGSADELLEEPFLCLFGDEEAATIGSFMGQFDPDDNIVDFLNILELVVGTDLVDFVEFGLHDLLIERCLEKGFCVLSPVPGWHDGCIFH